MPATNATKSTNARNATNATNTELLTTLPWPFSWPGLPGYPNIAPQFLNQPINPGWSFGNVIVNTGNSSAPALEMALVARHSYGRQLGKLMDAVEVLIKERGDQAETSQALCDFETLRQELDEARLKHQVDRLSELRKSLQNLRDEDPAAWASLVKAN